MKNILIILLAILIVQGCSNNIKDTIVNSENEYSNYLYIKQIDTFCNNYKDLKKN